MKTFFSKKSVTIVRGNLFENQEDSLAHCVSQCFTMGKGIAVVFKERYGHVDELKAQAVQVGGVATLQVNGGNPEDSHLGGSRWIYYLVTKKFYYGKPTMETLEQSLCACRDHALAHAVKTIAMPRIGCGLDRLDWNKVLALIGNVFADTGISIKIYSI